MTILWLTACLACGVIGWVVRGKPISQAVWVEATQRSPNEAPYHCRFLLRGALGSVDQPGSLVHEVRFTEREIENAIERARNNPADAIK